MEIAHKQGKCMTNNGRSEQSLSENSVDKKVNLKNNLEMVLRQSASRLLPTGKVQRHKVTLEIQLIRNVKTVEATSHTIRSVRQKVSNVTIVTRRITLFLEKD